VQYNRTNLFYVISKKFEKEENLFVDELKKRNFNVLKKNSLTNIKKELKNKIGKKDIKYFFFIRKSGILTSDIRKLINSLKQRFIDFELMFIKSEEQKDIDKEKSDEFLNLTLPKDLAIGISYIKKVINLDLRVDVKKFLSLRFKDKLEVNQSFVDIMVEDLEIKTFGIWGHKGIKSAEEKVYCDSYIGRSLVVPQKYLKIVKEKKIEIYKFYRWGNNYVVPITSKDTFIFYSKEKINLFEEEIIRESLCEAFKNSKPTLRPNDFKNESVDALKMVNVEAGLENLLYDFRDAINTIKTVSYMFKNSSEGPSISSTLKGILLTSCDDLLFLIIDLMSEKYQENLNVRPHTVNNIFDYLENKFRDVLSFYDISFEINRDSDLVIGCDGIKLKRAIGYLVNSSRKILVYEGIEKPLISILFKEKKQTFLFEVKNNGPHFNKKERVSFFEKMNFNENQEHSGLGFMIARKIVEEHNGNLKIKSGNDGISFHIEIPKDLIAS